MSEFEITKMDIYPISIPLIRPFKISLGTISGHISVFTRIELRNGSHGWGEAAPEPTITGETWRTALSIMEHHIKPYVLGKDVTKLEDILRTLNKMVPGNPGPIGAFDVAIYDAMARHAGVPLNALLGRANNDLETTITVGLEDKNETLRQAEALRKNGVSSIKIKIGGDPARDIERIQAVRSTLGDDFRLTVDANQGYTRRQAILVAKGLEGCNVDFFEQPVQAGNLEDMAIVREHSPIPIMADESVHTSRDALELTKRRAADMINIKLMKSGGISEARKIAAVADAADLPCMVGCMIETKIGVAAGCHFATSQPIVKFGDLDSHTSFSRNIVKGGLETLGSRNHLTGGVGIAAEIENVELEKGITS